MCTSLSDKWKVHSNEIQIQSIQCNFSSEIPIREICHEKSIFINGNYFSLFDIFHREIVQLNCILLSTPFCISDSRLAFCHRTFPGRRFSSTIYLDWCMTIHCAHRFDGCIDWSAAAHDERWLSAEALSIVRVDISCDTRPDRPFLALKPQTATFWLHFISEKLHVHLSLGISSTSIRIVSGSPGNGSGGIGSYRTTRIGCLFPVWEKEWGTDSRQWRIISGDPISPISHAPGFVFVTQRL